jgi:hypothetical protein
MLQYLRDRSRYQDKDGGLPNTNNAYRKAFSAPTPIHLQLPAIRKETNKPLPTDGGLPNTPGLPDIKLLPQNGGLPGSQSKEFKKKKAHFKKTEYKTLVEQKDDENINDENINDDGQKLIVDASGNRRTAKPITADLKQDFKELLNNDKIQIQDLDFLWKKHGTDWETYIQGKGGTQLQKNWKAIQAMANKNTLEEEKKE